MNSGQKAYAFCVVSLLAAFLIADEGGAEGREGGLGLNASSQGVVVMYTGGSAAKAGITVGDHVLTVNGIRTQDGQSLIGVVRLIEPGKTVPVTVVRNGKLLNLTWAVRSSTPEAPRVESPTPSSSPVGKPRTPAASRPAAKKQAPTPTRTPKIPDDLGDLD